MRLSVSLRALAAILTSLLPAVAVAQPSAVNHTPTAQAFGEAAGVTQRNPAVPREDEAVDLFFRVSFQFTYDRVCVYYTLDGSEPAGSFGSPSGTTAVLRNDLGTATFVRNEGSGPAMDWWKATLPAGARAYGTPVKYKLSAWQPFNGPEVFAGGGSSFAYSVKLAWPGAGAGQQSPAAGYPPVSFWKEEAVFGNTFCAGMIDQNATVYDFHFPTPGCVQGVGTKNEGYVDGLDTFPAGLPQGWRGQMHVNQAMVGVRVDGLTHWLSNPNGVSYDQVTQAYVTDSNTVRSTQRLFVGGNDIAVEQFDFAPYASLCPTVNGSPRRHLYVKRLRLTNHGAASKVANIYWYLDPALNGGDGYDAMGADPGHGAMIAVDNTYRVVHGTGTGFSPPEEYNPTTFPGYEKNVSLALACAMKSLNADGSTRLTAADFWRDTSADNGQGWMGLRETLPVNQTVEIDILMAGGFDNFAGATGTYDNQIAGVIDWFYGANIPALQSATDAAWAAWLHQGVWVDTPDTAYDALFSRGMLATALHVDGLNGGVIAGFHNGAYPFVWPRDAVYAAITLARTGHLAEAANVYTWMRTTCFRDGEPWGRPGFWKQKYTTDGYVVWGAPQIDETAAFPWGVYYQYQMTADSGFLAANYGAVRDAVLSCSQDSQDSRLRFEEAFGLMYSNNVWEDSYDTFVYSNAAVIRALRDAAAIASALGNGADAGDATARANTIKAGLDGRLDWDGENTDISQLGIVYPFDIYGSTDSRSARIIDRLNGTRTKFNNTHCCAEPLLNASGEHAGTVNRYWGDGYWNGGPWFLSTAWHGLYYAARQDSTPGKADIDTHKQRMDAMIARIGPAGLGAEQIAYGTGGGASLLYPGQQDFRLQTAWPNAWESESTLVDAVMKFIDYRPDAPANTMVFAPKLPTAWSTLSVHNVTLIHTPTGRTHRVDTTVTESAGAVEQTFTNTSGFALNVYTTLRIPAGAGACPVTVNGQPANVTSRNEALGTVQVYTVLPAAPGSVTTVRVEYGFNANCDHSTTAPVLNVQDFTCFLQKYSSGDLYANCDGSVVAPVLNVQDFTCFLQRYSAGCH